jgi:hypothetical protein
VNNQLNNRSRMPLRLFSIDKPAPAPAPSSLAARASAIVNSVTGRSASPRSQHATHAVYAPHDAPNREPRADSESGDSSASEGDEDDDEGDDATADAAACTLAAAHAAAQLASPADVDSWVPHPRPPASTNAWVASDGAYLGDALVGATVSVLDVQGQRAHAKVLLYAGRGEPNAHTPYVLTLLAVV